MSRYVARFRSTSLPKDSRTMNSYANEDEVFEDARSEPDEIRPVPAQQSDRNETYFSDLELLPPLETFLDKWHRDLGGDVTSLAASLELENDVLPSTPLTEEQLLHADSVLKEELTELPINRLPDADDGETAKVDNDDYYYYYDIKGMMMNAAEQAEEFAIAIWHKFQSWKVIHFTHLPQWLQDNDFLHFGHRPPLPTSECFKSIIRIHTETGNIWTHLLGKDYLHNQKSMGRILPQGIRDFPLIKCAASFSLKSLFPCRCCGFHWLGRFFLVKTFLRNPVAREVGFRLLLHRSHYLHGPVISLSYLVLQQRQENRTTVCKVSFSFPPMVFTNYFVFIRFDYCGISFLTVGSFVPWLYYSFYCDWKPQVIYLSIVIVLGIGAVVVSTFDFFAGPRFRPLRAGGSFE